MSSSGVKWGRRFLRAHKGLRAVLILNLVVTVQCQAASPLQDIFIFLLGQVDRHDFDWNVLEADLGNQVVCGIFPDPLDAFDPVLIAICTRGQQLLYQDSMRNHFEELEGANMEIPAENFARKFSEVLV
ncbi:hypothetical protein HG530_001005 [Fusarium avenaceum]|nr:hypothetical protein HG530_001005 [Fusarium avenaceum]